MYHELRKRGTRRASKGEHAMRWLEPGEDVLQLLRGSYGLVAPPLPSHSEAVFDFLLLLVICGALLVILIAGLKQLWQRLAEALRLKRRMGAAASSLDGASSKRSQRRDPGETTGWPVANATTISSFVAATDNGLLRITATDRVGQETTAGDLSQGASAGRRFSVSERRVFP